MELINSITNEWVEAYINHPKASLMISTDNDNTTGLDIVEYIYHKLRKTSKIPLYKVEMKNKKSIGIEEIRDMQKNLTLKADNDSDYTRFVVISEAEKLTKEAQNALLKLLEELPDKTILMLVVSDETSMLQTILSRCFMIKVLPISEKQALNYGKKAGISDEQVKKAFIISEGGASVFTDLLEGRGEKIEEMITLAKDFIKSTIPERQKILATIYKKEVSEVEFIQSLKLTARAGMRHAKDISTKNHWKNILSQIIITEKQLQSNVQTKLALLALSVSI